MDQTVNGRKVPTGTILLVLSLLTALIPAPGAANQGGANTPSAVKRVERFPRPAEMRIKPPAGATGSRPTHACPRTLEMCQKFWAIAGHFLNDPTIPVRDRELLVLRTAWLSRVDYEWGSHVTIAEEAGITEQEISRVTQGADAKGWSEFDAALLRAADELHSNRFITDATWQTLAGRYADHQLVEVVLTVGNYTLLGMYFNTIGVPVEPGMAQVPDQ